MLNKIKKHMKVNIELEFFQVALVFFTSMLFLTADVN